MNKNSSRALQEKLLSYGIIPTLCLGMMNLSMLEATDQQQKECLIILEGRQKGKVPEGSNLQQKVVSLSAHAAEQSEKIRSLKEEVQQLKNKLHLAQLHAFSGEAGNYKQLYTALKQESAQNKANQSRLEKIISELKEENEVEKQKSRQVEAQIASLLEALSEKSTSSQPHADLETELSNYKNNELQLKELIQQLKHENENDKQKLVEVEVSNHSLLNALKEQKKSMQALHDEHQKHLESLSSTALEENENYKILYAALELDYQKNKEVQAKLEELIKNLQIENQSNQQLIEDAEIRFANLYKSMQEQSLAMEKIQEDHHKLIEQMASKDISPSIDNTLGLYEAWEEEHHLSLLAKRSASNLLSALEAELLLTKDALAALQKEHEEKIQKLHDQYQQDTSATASGGFNALLMHLYNTLQGESEHLSSKDSDSQQLLTEIQEEKEKSKALQKNLDELQQIYDQTVKLYNEIYSDYTTAQKNLEKIQKELDERKSDHLVEVDGYEVKLEQLAQELSTEKNKVQELQKELEKPSSNLSSDNIALQEDLLRSEIENLKKTIFDQSIILQQVYQDKQNLATQLQLIPYTTDEVIQLSERSGHLNRELDALKSTLYHHLDAYTAQEDLLNSTLNDLENYEKSIQEHQQNKESQSALLNEKLEEIRSLNDKIAKTEDLVKFQLKEFAANLETEKFKNYDAQQEIARQQALRKSYEDQLKENYKEVELLKDTLAIRDQNLLLKKVEMEDLFDKFKDVSHQNSQLKLQIGSVLDTKSNDIVQTNNQFQIIQEKDAYISRLEDSLNDLKNALAKKEDALSEHSNHSQSLISQRNKFEEQLLSALKEKQDLEEKYASSLAREEEIKSILEKNIAELNEHKESIGKLEKAHQETLESLAKMREMEEENQKLLALIDNLKIELDQAASDHQQKLDEKIALENNLKQTLEKTTLELSDYKNNLDEVQKRTHDHPELVAKLKTANEENQNLNNQLSQLQELFNKEKKDLIQHLEEKISLERQLKVSLEKSSDDLDEYKTVLRDFEHNPQDTPEAISRMQHLLDENLRLSQQIADIQNNYDADKALLKDLHQKQLAANELLENSQQVQAENQKLSEEINSLKQKLQDYENEASAKNNSEHLFVQLERLQEALQQTMNDKTALQSQYQEQLIAERILNEKLEETLADLEQRKADLEEMEKTQGVLMQELDTYRLISH